MRHDFGADAHGAVERVVEIEPSSEIQTITRRKLVVNAVDGQSLGGSIDYWCVCVSYFHASRCFISSINVA